MCLYFIMCLEVDSVVQGVLLCISNVLYEPFMSVFWFLLLSNYFLSGLLLLFEVIFEWSIITTELLELVIML